MHNIRKRFFRSCSDNPKSKIPNQKWAGLFSIIVALTVCGAKAEAQQPRKVARIGYLSTFDTATDSTRFDAIRLALRELGYIEGHNIVIEHRYGEGKRIDSLSLRPSWCDSRWISSWCLEGAG